MATFFILLSHPTTFLNKKILSHGALVKIGLISYPLYLWHWPLLSFARILSSGVSELEIRIGIVVLSTLLSWLTYRFIEMPLRFGAYTKAKTLFLCFATCNSSQRNR